MRYGLGDLADLYRDRMTLRQLWVRVQAIPADSVLWETVRAEQQERAEQQQLRDLDNVLAMFPRPGPKEG